MKAPIIIALAAILLSAQTMATDPCAIHFDKSFYVTGEVAWFRVYLPESLEYEQSLIQVHVVDPTNEVVETLYFPVDQDQGTSGNFKVPYDWISGVYYFIVTAQKEETNQYVELLRHPVPIYSDLNQQALVNDTTAVGFESPVNPSQDQLTIRVETDRSTYGYRGSVRATVRVTDRSGNPAKAILSLAVRDEVLAQVLSWPSYAQRDFDGTAFKVENDLTITGKVTDLGSDQGLGFAYLAAALPQQKSFKLFNADEEGIFTLDFPTAYGRQQIQLVDYRDREIAVSLLPPIEFRKENDMPALVYGQPIQDYLELSRRRKKVAQVFDLMASPNASTVNQDSLGIVPDRRIVLSDFEPFENMTELFKELVTPLKIKKKKTGIHRVKMVNPENKPFYAGTPIFMIDGFVTRDTEFAAALDIKNIERIDLYFFHQKLQEHFGSLGRSGVVMITTKDQAIALPEKDGRNIFGVRGLATDVSFPQLEIATSSDNATHTPYFRPVLHWDPVIKTNEQGIAEVQFQQSDDQSTFEIELLGRSSSGVFGVGKYSYQVK